MPTTITLPNARPAPVDLTGSIALMGAPMSFARSHEIYCENARTSPTTSA